MVALNEHAAGPDPQVLDTRSEIASIIAEPDQGRYERLVEEFLASRKRQFVRMAGNLCRINSVRRSDYIDEVESMVAIECWEMIQTARRDALYLDKIRGWEAILHHNARAKVRAFLDQATAPASGMTAAQRRYREIAKTRSELTAARGQTPEIAEVIAKTNERLQATRKNVVRQGMVVTEEDYYFQRSTAAYDDTLDAPAHQVDFAENYILHPAEGPTLVSEVVELASQEDELTGKVAKLWMFDAYSTGGAGASTDTVTWISKELGLSRSQTNLRINAVRMIAIDYLARMGITGAAVA